VVPKLRPLKRGTASITIIAVLLLAGCGGGDDATPTGPRSSSEAGPDDDGTIPVGDGDGGVGLSKLGDFDQPVYVSQPPDDRRHLFVVEQAGRIIVLRDGRPLAKPFLDLSGQVSCCGEQGLLSVAFAPDYAQSGRFYVNYTDRGGDTRVVEYGRSADDPLVADPDSRRVILGVDQPFENHNGGLVLFGPDGLLYIGMGDGGSQDDPNRNGQDLGTLLGKILRIDPRASGGKPYSVPADNPFVDRPGARPEIYSYGLRNPWRFSFDPLTGDLSIGDVGQDKFEEVDLVRKGEGRGANFGWSAYEGLARFNEDQKAPDAVPPVLVFGHDSGCSITGGYVVRDQGLPTLYGRYLYGDFCAGALRSFTARPDRRATDDRGLGVQIPSLSSFGEDDAGHIYATSLEGPVYRLVGEGG
jgi:glucose/arabinose dehydrogenase